MDDKELSGFGLAQLKPEGRHCTYEPEDLNILSHVVCKLKNRALDKADKRKRSNESS